VRAETPRSRAGALSWPRTFARGRTDRDAALVLSALRGITPRRLLELAQTDRTAATVLERIRSGGAGSANDVAAARVLRPETIAGSLAQAGARFVVVGDPEYPSQLEHLADPPLGLFVRGRALVPGRALVAIVGARGCSDLGRDLARDLGRALADSGVSVVSGAARGIDAAAHEGSLDAGGLTVAVLGCGIDAVYPPGSRPLVRRILERGTVVSEYPPGVPPDGFRFPARNRIVAALARAVVVVEGRARSGSLISAEHALDLGRDVFAVPGAVSNPLSETPHRLIREGATLIRGAADLLLELGFDGPAQADPVDLDLPPAERRALDAVRGSVVPDRVAAALGVRAPEALALLLRLELRGLVRSVGGRFERRIVPAPGTRGPATGHRPDRRGPRCPRSGGPPGEA
jgi:DNA processing protein